MRTSDQGLALIKKHEGLRLSIYDCPAGYKTIGYGHLVKTAMTEITKGEADKLLREDVKIAESALTGNFTQNQFDALVSLIFNIGVSAFKNSTLRKYLSDANFQSASYPTMESAWKAWDKVKGAPLPGLTRRRAEEWEMFNK
ncbi:MAG: lysozyme [Rickettsiales bacterium]|jgi:lysozyme|nr:lysozyme [Rickettsiales bacterium]